MAAISRSRRSDKRPARVRRCAWCSRSFVPRKTSQRYCSRGCRQGSRRRQDRLLARYVTEKGYVRGEVWRDGRRVRVYEHRWAMEQLLGRRLDPAESVHHINGNRTDNRPANLRLYPSISAHLRAEHAQRQRASASTTGESR